MIEKEYENKEVDFEKDYKALMKQYTETVEKIGDLAEENTHLRMTIKGMENQKEEIDRKNIIIDMLTDEIKRLKEGNDEY